MSAELDTFGIPEHFVQHLARIEEAGPCRRMIFAISRESGPGGPYRTAVVSLVLPAEGLPDTVQALVTDISKPASLSAAARTLCRFSSQARRNMRNNWTLTPSEMALFLAAVTCLAGGFMMAAGG
jgi:hypothetical protein